MVYIRSIANISPQPTFGQPLAEALFAAPAPPDGDRMRAIEPDYSRYVDPKMIRRMSRVIRMGVAAAMECLRNAGGAGEPAHSVAGGAGQPAGTVDNLADGPQGRATGGLATDAILIGTAYGCLEDTGVFLRRMIENKEEMLTPTAFIQSTHNTVGAQIALLLKNHGYNNTYVHRGWSFESALLDGIMYIAEHEGRKVLVGGVDEITDASHAILSRFGLYRDGTVDGEGAAFFLLSDEAGPENLARLDGVTTFYKPKNAEEIQENVVSFLSSYNLDINKIDLVISGGSIDFPKVLHYKALSGEYPTASAYALWMGAAVLATGLVPEGVGAAGGMAASPPATRPRRVLVYNQHQQTHHSLFLLSAC